MTFDPTPLIAPGCMILAGACFGMAVRKLSRSTEALARRLDEISERVDRDPLTGVYNRGAGENLMAQSLRAFPCVVAFVDVDDFRRVNKERGWGEGDRLLRDLGERLGASFRRAHDVVYRCGNASDEFVVCVPAISPRIDYVMMTDEERAELKDPFGAALRYVQDELRDISESALARITFGVSSTRQVQPSMVLQDAQELVRLAKRRRDELREVHHRAEGGIESEHEVLT